MGFSFYFDKQGSLAFSFDYRFSRGSNVNGCLEVLLSTISILMGDKYRFWRRNKFEKSDFYILSMIEM